MAAEFAVPMWEFGYSTYAILSDGRIACLYRQSGVHHLAVLDPNTGELLDLDLPYTCYDPYVRARGTAATEVKRGWGGIRDVEFAVQLLQIVHGRRDDSGTRVRPLPGVSALVAQEGQDRAGESLGRERS